MKRIIISLIAFVCVSFFSQVYATPTVEKSTWMSQNSAYETQKVASIWIENPGELAGALQQLADEGYEFQYLHLSAFNSSNTTLELSAEDIAALNALDVKTIEMNHVYAPYFEFNNPYVEYITLPYNWTKAQVKAVGETHKTHPNFKACISTSNTENSGDATLIAYLNEAGTMRDAILHSYFDTRDYKTLGSGSGDCSRVRTLVAMGNICAKDISRAGNYDANGHYVINGVADENSDTKNKNTEGGDLYTLTETAGAIMGCHDINVIDLSEAIIPDEYCADIVPHYGGIQTTNLREFWIPEDPNFKTIPADFMNCSAAIHQICIPGNIETIRTRAFAGTNINYIWTTGPDPSVRYDNGATFITGANTADEVRAQRYKTEVGKEITPTENFDPAVEYPRFGANDDNSFNYGTFTLPAGLKLIERFAFYSSTSVSDVYMLNPVAPECHVDGFNSSMYHANNTVQASSIKEETDEDGNTIKIITRDAYNNGINQPMAMLHYPQETGTPNTQRYTDPTREYSIATGDRDGRGNMLYFPTQTEFEVAEWQGTFGYLWNAWNIERTWYNQEITLGRDQGWYGGDFGSTGGYNQAGGQAKANQFYIDNPNPNPNNTDPDKTDRSFYDVTADGSLSQPAGLDWYYNATRSGHTLYPQMETTETTEVIGERQSVDSNGDPIFDECPNGNYVKDFIYVPAENGEYVQVATVNGYQGTQTPVEGVSTYYSDNQGSNAVTPKVQNGYFFEDGVKNVYTQVDKNNDAIGARDQYYTKNGDTYTESNLMFNNTYYYTTGNQVEKPVWGYVQGWNKTVSGLLALSSEFYKKVGDEYVKFNPTFGNSNTYYYYVDGSSDPIGTTTMVEGVTQYYQYQSWSNPNYQPVDPQIQDDVYYPNGTETVDEYLGSTYYIADKSWYSYDQNNKTYTAITLSWYNHFTNETYYYVSGTEANYSSADGQDYNASTTYYTSNTGETEVNPVNFNTTYYYPTYDYSYVDYTGQEGDRYTKKDSYREWTSTDGETQRYCPRMENVYATIKGTQYDYRGWHQFVLAGYGYNGVIPNEPIRSFISDNDWWTICEPYDLRYNDMVMFFGTDHASLPKKIPYLSKLMYVIRDVKEGKITLMFSKNLMEYKEAIAETGQVHGTIDEETTWIGTGEGQYADEAALMRANPIILHKGVPYLIRPNLMVDDSGNVTSTRQFNVYKTDDPELYKRLNDAAKLGAAAHANMIYDGIYTVPSYVVGLGEEGAGTEAVESTGEKTITNKDGSSFTYKDSEHGGKLIYGGKEVSYKISSKNTYSFVGSFYKSLMPQYCYFLGWDSNKNCATFWYSAVQDKSGWNWNNETGIICPNFPTGTKISSATGFNDPARWKIAGADGTILQPDDITMPTPSGAKNYTMDFGATNYFDMDEATGIKEVVPTTTNSETINVYNVNGVFMGNSVEGLAKGIYIVNGKKYVVK